MGLIYLPMCARAGWEWNSEIAHSMSARLWHIKERLANRLSKRRKNSQGDVSKSAIAQSSGLRIQRLVLQLRQKPPPTTLSPMRGIFVRFAQPETNRPFMVIDDGWQASRQGEKSATNPWDRTNGKFGSTMADVAKRIKDLNARPGLWYRPLEAWPDAPDSWRLKNRHSVFDPSVPEVLVVIAENMKRFHTWGYELVKHDFSTNEISGQWGRGMGDQIGKDGWSFADRTHTTAEIVLNFYRTIREAAGDDTVIDGCNTISHLSAGIFELQRIGDDTSGQHWKSTKEMGVNCLAFRGPQNGAFYFVDADCAGLATAGAVPWEKNSQWLDLLARSGTPLFVSWPKRLVGAGAGKSVERCTFVGIPTAAVGRADRLDD